MTTNTQPRAGKLEVTTPSDREITMTRSFHAPRALVFDAMVKPELLRRWMIGPPGWTMAACEVDLRVGGTYRVVWRADPGAATSPQEPAGPAEFVVHGVYREVVVPERIVNTESMGPTESLQTQTFTEANGLTTFTVTTLFGSREECDAALKSGMAEGTGACYDRLEEILAETA